MDQILDMLEKIFLTDWTFSLLKIAVIFILTIVLNRIIKKIFNRKVIDRLHDKTHLVFIRHLLTGLIYFTGFASAAMQIPGFENAVVSILASSGIFALVVGFASQQAFSNIISGLFISMFKPFRIGDRVSFINKNTSGVVEDITLRHTVVRTFENKMIIIPNSLINTEIIENSNIIDEKMCRFVDFGISYDSDINKAIGIMKEEILTHPLFLDNRTEAAVASGDDPVPVRVIGFSDSAVNLRGWAWAKDAGSSFIMGCDLNKSIKERFDKEGIEIPYPHRTIVYKSQD